MISGFGWFLCIWQCPVVWALVLSGVGVWNVCYSWMAVSMVPAFFLWLFAVIHVVWRSVGAHVGVAQMRNCAATFWRYSISIL